MHSRLVAVAATAAIALMAPTGALAQDATPMASPVGESLFAELGLPELTITVTDEGIEIDRSDIEAGRYLVTLNNESAEPEVFAGFVQIPEDRTLEDLSYADEVAAGTPIPEEGPAEEDFLWLYETYIAGGPSTVTEAARQVVVNLPAGSYGVWDEDPTSPRLAAALTVTGDPGVRVEGPEPEAAVTIIEEGEGGVGFSFRLDGEFVAGPQVVKVLNASDQPHFVEVSQYPEEITVEQVMATFMFDPSSGATPSPDMLDYERAIFAGWAGTQSPGATQWVIVDVAPGQVLVDCFIPDPLAEFTPHAFEGMLQLFEVAES
ncbi:MAG: hypothetical protein H0V00_13060 [Chloroflexia bacterium]|nr:hypothetical protein [Chloroflexia bacterium]